jgi:addiction module HigA family antidote
MAEYAAKRDPNRCPSHPGALLREVIPATGKSKAQIAALLGISRQHLYDILKERKPVSPGVAVRLGKLFGDGAGVWVRLRHLARRARIGRRNQEDTEAEGSRGVNESWPGRGHHA